MGNRSPATTATLTGKPTSWAARTFDSLHIPQYRRFWTAMMFQMGSMNMQMVAQAWLVYELTNSYTALGWISIANAVPNLLVSLYGGVLADRVPKKAVIIVGQALSSLLAFAVALCILLGFINLERGTGVLILMIASALRGLVQGVVMPSRSAIIPEVVGRERLTNAVALNNAGMNMNRLLAPGLAGLLIAVLGVQTVFFTMTALEIMGAVTMIGLRTAPVPTTAVRRKPVADIREGLQYIWGNSVVVGLLVLTLISVLLSMPYMSLMPGFAKDIQIVHAGEFSWVGNIPFLGSVPDLLTKSSFRLGLLTSISGVGALTGSLLVASMIAGRRGSAFLWSILGTGAFLALFALTTSFAFALLFMIGVGFAQSARMALSNSLVQEVVDDEHRGRVMSIYMMEFGLSSFSSFGVAVLADSLGIQWAVGGAALLLVPIAIFYFLFLPGIRRMG